MPGWLDGFKKKTNDVEAVVGESVKKVAASMEEAMEMVSPQLEEIGKIWADGLSGGFFHHEQNSTATPMTPVQQLYEIISHYNSGETKVYYPMRKDNTGTLDAYIGKNSPEQNKQIAQLIYDASVKFDLDYLFLACVINQESQFSPACFNYNLSQSNLKPNFSHTDWSLAQFSGAFLPSKPGMDGLSEEEMIAKASDPTWSVPTMASVYAGLMQSARKSLQDEDFSKKVSKLNTSGESDLFVTTANFYNRGILGATKYINDNNADMLKHGNRCMVWYNQMKNFVATGIFSSAKSLRIPDEGEYFTDHEER